MLSISFVQQLLNGHRKHYTLPFNIYYFTVQQLLNEAVI